MPKQIDINENLHAEVKAEVAHRNALEKFNMADASEEAFPAWIKTSRSHRKSENQKNGKLAIAS